jgi:hypothetical protein
VRPRSPEEAEPLVKICRISATALARHVRQKPSEVGAIFIRKVDKEAKTEVTHLPTEVQKDYMEFRELFEEDKANVLPEHQP